MHYVKSMLSCNLWQLYFTSTDIDFLLCAAAIHKYPVDLKYCEPFDFTIGLEDLQFFHLNHTFLVNKGLNKEEPSQKTLMLQYLQIITTY